MDSVSYTHLDVYKRQDYLIAIGGGSSMDTSKAIGIIIANPEFEDVRSLEGVAPVSYTHLKGSKDIIDACLHAIRCIP